MTEIVRRNQNTVWYINLDKVRAAVKTEKTLRHVTFAGIEDETGVNAISIGQFLSGTGLAMDGVVSLIKWTNKKIDTFATQRRQITSKEDSKSERELRLLHQFLTSNNIEVEPGESPVVAAIRAMSTTS